MKLFAPLAILSVFQVTSASVPIEWEQIRQGKNWTEHATKALDDLGENLLGMSPPLDASEYCPRFGDLTKEQRKVFYVNLLSFIARLESDFNPEATYEEGFKDAKGKPVVSRGLLQLSQESANLYGCGIRSASDLHDAATNLRCGVRVLNKWVAADRRIGSSSIGGGRYWAVLRDPKRAKILARTNSLPLCRRTDPSK